MTGFDPRTGWRDATPRADHGIPLHHDPRQDPRALTRRPRPSLNSVSNTESIASRWAGYLCLAACALALASIIVPALWEAFHG